MRHACSFAVRYPPRPSGPVDDHLQQPADQHVCSHNDRRVRSADDRTQGESVHHGGLSALPSEPPTFAADRKVGDAVCHIISIPAWQRKTLASTSATFIYLTARRARR